MEKIIFKNGEAPYLSDNTLMEMQTNIETAIAERTPTIELLTVSATVPTECNIGDKYYNTTTSKIYTATATNTWGTVGEDPSNLYLYADIEHKELYYYDGTDFKSYGSGKKEVGYANEPLEGTEVILLEDEDFSGTNSIDLAKVEQNLSSNSEETVPSVKAVNNAFESGTGYIKYVDGTMICYGEYSFSAQTLSDYYNFCKLTPSINVTFPKQFKETPTITISSKMFQMFSTFVDSVNNSSFKFRGCYPSIYSSLGGVIEYIAIGKWK